MITIRKKVFNYGFITVGLFLILWQTTAMLNIINPIYIGTPHLVLIKMIEIVKSSEFLTQISNSGTSFAIGYLSAIAIGGILGLYLGTNDKVKEAASPFVYLFNSIPYVAILPLLIIWFGMGMVAKSAIVFLMVLSPMTIYTIDSVKTIDKNLLGMTNAFRLKKSDRFIQLYFYHSLPHMFAGARVGLGRGMTAVIISEIFGLGKGIAYHINYYGGTFQTDKLMATVLIILLINWFFLNLLKVVQKKVMYWN